MSNTPAPPEESMSVEDFITNVDQDPTIMQGQLQAVIMSLLEVLASPAFEYWEKTGPSSDREDRRRSIFSVMASIVPTLHDALLIRIQNRDELKRLLQEMINLRLLLKQLLTRNQPNA